MKALFFSTITKYDTFIKVNTKIMNFSLQEPLGGFSSIDFYLLDEVSNFPTVITDTNARDIHLMPFENNVQGTIEPDSITVNVTPKQGPEGVVYHIAISFRFITRSEALEQLLEQYQHYPGIVIATLNNDFKKLYGTNLEPLYLIFDVDDSNKIDGMCYTEVRIKGETRQRPVYYTPL